MISWTGVSHVRQMRRARDERGMTLIELAVVVVVLGRALCRVAPRPRDQAVREG